MFILQLFFPSGGSGETSSLRFRRKMWFLFVLMGKTSRYGRQAAIKRVQFDL